MSKQIMQHQLDEILLKHEKWLHDNVKGERADLSNIDLRGTKLENANLECAILNKANLSGMNLSNVNFKAAKLSGTNFKKANLYKANFEDTLITENIPIERIYPITITMIFDIGEWIFAFLGIIALCFVSIKGFWGDVAYYSWLVSNIFFGLNSIRKKDIPQAIIFYCLFVISGNGLIK